MWVVGGCRAATRGAIGGRLSLRLNPLTCARSPPTNAVKDSGSQAPAWEPTGLQALPAESEARASKAVRSQAEPGTEENGSSKNS